MKFEPGKKTVLVIPNGMALYGTVESSDHQRVVLHSGGVVALGSVAKGISGEEPLPMDPCPGTFQVSKSMLIAAFDGELVRTVDMEEEQQ